MYVHPNYRTKKALKEAVAKGEQVTIFQPGPFGGNEPLNASGLAVEGPHYPEPHRWYAQVDVDGGVVVAVK